MREQGREIIMIGHAGHPEVEGTMGQAEGDGPAMYLVETEEDVENLKVKDPTHLAYVTQTTLSVDDATRVIKALKKRFPKITGPKKDDICYATQNRQDAVKMMVKQCDLVIVVGSPNSSNSNRLCEVARNAGVDAYMIDRAEHLQEAWLEGKDRIGITAGASAPEVLVQEVISRLRQIGAGQAGREVMVEELSGVVESVVFPLPKN
jgi:4-hydroxy-3-methylbut-2-enyl diphosphate reductase